MRPFLVCAVLALVVAMTTAKPLSTNAQLRSLLKAIAEKKAFDKSGSHEGSGKSFESHEGSGLPFEGSGTPHGSGEGIIVGPGGIAPGPFGPLGEFSGLLHNIIEILQQIKAALGIEEGSGFPMLYKKGMGNGGNVGKPEKPEKPEEIGFSGDGSGKPPFIPDHGSGFKPPFKPDGSGFPPFFPDFSGHGSGDKPKPPFGSGMGGGEVLTGLLESFSTKDLKELVRALEELKRK